MTKQNLMLDILTCIGLAFTASSWSSLILTENMVFYANLLFLSSFLIFILLLLFAIPKLRGSNMPSRIDFLAFAFVVSLAAFNCTFASDNFLGGIDNGVYSNAAVYLTRNHSLVVDEPVLLPGLMYRGDHLIVGFHLGYISWLASQYALFGIEGIRFSNFIPFVVGMLSLYFLGKKLGDDRAGLVCILMFGTTYPMFWFARGTYDEIYSLALIFFGLLCFLRAYENKQGNYLVLAVVALGLFLHTRIEAVGIFGAFLSVMSYLYLVAEEKWIFNKKTGTMIMLVILHLIYYSSIWISPISLFQERIDAGVIQSTISPGGILGGLMSTVNDLISLQKPPSFQHHMTDYVFRVLSKYNLFWSIALVPITLLLQLRSLQLKKAKEILLVFLITFPTFIYVFTPFTNPQQPWFLKRYVFAILPISFLLSTLLLAGRLRGSQRKKYTLTLLVLLVILTNLLTAFPILFHRDYEGMINQVERISMRFKEDDIILVDRSAAGNYKIADPMFYVFGRKTIWVGPPGDWCSVDKVLKSIPTGHTVYILIDSNNSWLRDYFPEKSMEFYFQMNLTYKELQWTVDLLHYPRCPSNMYEIDYAVVKDLIEVPSQINIRTHTILVYKLDLMF